MLFFHIHEKNLRLYIPNLFVKKFESSDTLIRMYDSITAVVITAIIFTFNILILVKWQIIHACIFNLVW